MILVASAYKPMLLHDNFFYNLRCTGDNKSSESFHYYGLHRCMQNWNFACRVTLMRFFVIIFKTTENTNDR